MAEIFTQLCTELRKAGTKDRAQKEKSYQKSQWTHWGVALPTMDAVLRPYKKTLAQDDLIPLAYRLWEEPVWDCKIVAGRMLAYSQVKDLNRVWAFVQEKLPEMDGWAVEDNLAGAARRCLLADEKRLDEVEAWLNHPSFWVRRAALVYTLPWTKPGMDPTRSLGWAARMVEDEEWFIQKAIGWWLRELSKHDPDRVKTFLSEHEHALKTVARREARKYL